MTTEDMIAMFLALRPYYSREHVEDIATFTIAEGIPFCTACVDWHRPNEDHSGPENEFTPANITV